MKIITIVGARPQFIKASVVSRAITKYNRDHLPQLEEVILHTGQHFDYNMDAVFFEQLKIPAPKYNLHVDSLPHGAMTGRMLEKIEGVLFDEKPDWVLVYGDTNSTLAGALAARKMNIPVGHVEAGLRSYNLKMPEEQNRLLTDRISNLLFCPTRLARLNLEKEGIPDSRYFQKVEVSGDVMLDAALFFSGISNRQSTLLDSMQLKQESFILATLHRAENTDNPDNLKSILNALQEIAHSVNVVLPLHPRTRNKLNGLNLKTEPLRIIEPVSYLDMIALEQNCVAVFTDSGGMQKEAYYFRKPCVTLREETEWTELVDARVNTLTGASQERILSAYRAIDSVSSDAFDQELYGNGTAGDRIAAILAANASGDSVDRVS